MKKLLLALLMLCGATACNFLQVKVSPDPFYSAVLQQDSNNRAALYAQGERFIRAGRYGDALKYFVRLTRLEPKSANAWFSLGRCYYETHQYGKAREAFEKTQELQPTEATLLGLAAATLMNGDVAGARELANQSEQKYGASAALLQVRGDIAYFSGDWSNALQFYRQSLEKNPNQPEIQGRVKDLDTFLASAG
jgi:tetratricopeptide (TPR) repeat protein